MLVGSVLCARIIGIFTRKTSNTSSTLSFIIWPASTVFAVPRFSPFFRNCSTLSTSVPVGYQLSLARNLSHVTQKAGRIAPSAPILWVDVLPLLVSRFRVYE